MNVAPATRRSKGRVRDGGGARLDDGVGQGEFGGKRFVGLPVILLLHPLLVKVTYLGHFVISFARLSANSISDVGVFCVFLMKTRTTTTRLPWAVT